MGANPLRHSRFEWEGGCGQAKPPTRKSSEGGGGDGRKSSPSLELRVGGWLWAGKASLDVPRSALDVAERGGIGDGMRWFNQSAMAFFKTPVSWLQASFAPY